VIELAVICGLLIALLAWQQIDRRHERKEVAAERRGLLLRIQSPQTAAAIDFNETVEPGPAAIDMSDGETGDESYWASREEFAEKAAAEELAARG
jgi:hypothetical protein